MYWWLRLVSVFCLVWTGSSLCTIHVKKTYSCHWRITDCSKAHHNQHSVHPVSYWYNSNPSYSTKEEPSTFYRNASMSPELKKVKSIILPLSIVQDNDCLILSLNKAIHITGGKLEVRYNISEGNLNSVKVSVRETHAVSSKKLRKSRKAQNKFFIKPVQFPGSGETDVQSVPETPAAKPAENQPFNVSIAYMNPYLRITLSGHNDNRKYSAQLCPVFPGCKDIKWCLPLHKYVTDVYQLPIPDKDFFIMVLPTACDQPNYGKTAESRPFTFSRKDNFEVGKCVRQECLDWTIGTFFNIDPVPNEKKIKLRLEGPDLCHYPADRFEFELRKNAIVTETSCSGETVNKTVIYVTANTTTQNWPTIETEMTDLLPGNYCAKATAVIPSCYPNTRRSQHTVITELTEPVSKDPTVLHPNPLSTMGWQAAVLSVVGVLVGLGVAIGLWKLYKYKRPEPGNKNLVPQPKPKHNFQHYIDELIQKPADLRLKVFLLHCVKNISFVSALKAFLEACCHIKVIDCLDGEEENLLYTESVGSYVNTTPYRFNSTILLTDQESGALLRRMCQANLGNEPQVKFEDLPDNERLFFQLCHSIIDKRWVDPSLRQSTNFYALSVGTLPADARVFVSHLGLHSEYNNLPECLPDLFLALHKIPQERLNCNWRSIVQSNWNRDSYNNFLRELEAPCYETRV